MNIQCVQGNAQNIKIDVLDLIQTLDYIEVATCNKFNWSLVSAEGTAIASGTAASLLISTWTSDGTAAAGATTVKIDAPTGGTGEPVRDYVVMISGQYDRAQYRTIERYDTTNKMIYLDAPLDYEVADGQTITLLWAVITLTSSQPSTPQFDALLKLDLTYVSGGTTTVKYPDLRYLVDFTRSRLVNPGTDTAFRTRYYGWAASPNLPAGMKRRGFRPILQHAWELVCDTLRAKGLQPSYVMQVERLEDVVYDYACALMAKNGNFPAWVQREEYAQMAKDLWDQATERLAAMIQGGIWYDSSGDEKKDEDEDQRSFGVVQLTR